MAPLDSDIYPRSLCFRSYQRERAFISLRHQKLKTRVFIGVGTVLGYLLAALGLAWRGIAPPEDESHPVLFVRYGVALWAILVCVAWMAVSWPCWCRCRFIDPSWYEFATACVLVHFALLCVLMEPLYLAKLFGADAGKTVYEAYKTDHKLLFWLNLWLTVCHFMLPMRWKLLLPLEITCVLSYVVPAFALDKGYDYSYLSVNSIMFAALTCTVSIGKRDLEVYERTAFVQVAQERTLRAQAERRLAQAEVSNASAQPSSDASASETTGTTGQIFDVSNTRGCVSVSEQLVRMVQLGTQEHWLVHAEDLQLESDCVLGHGGFGLVVRALYQGAEVAVKMSTTTGGWVAPQKLLAMAQELRIFRRLRHPNIVQCYGAYINPVSPDIALVLEYVRGVSLSMAVVGPCLSFPACSFRCQLINDICCGVNYLHGLKPAIIHGDIKDSNVMVERMGTFARGKLLDFGLSRLLTPGAGSLGGTVRWMAPEVITKQEGAVALSADIFSLGRLIYYIIVGEKPLCNVDHSFICDQARAGHCPELEWPEQTLLGKETRDVVAACTSFEPSERPGIIGVQAMLRGWSASASPQGLATTVARAFPQSTEPRPDLATKLSRARASVRGGGGRARSSTPRAGHHGSAADGVRRAGYEATPETAMVLSLLKTMAHWNVPTHSDDCCELHNTVYVAQRVLDNIHTSSCAAIAMGQAVQCSRCLMLVSTELGNGQTCFFCGNTHADCTVRHSLGSIPQLPEIPAAGGPGEGVPLHRVRGCRCAATPAKRGGLDAKDEGDGGDRLPISL